MLFLVPGGVITIHIIRSGVGQVEKALWPAESMANLPIDSENGDITRESPGDG
jgi:predicted pyridoxine 5'-phosphate oxidase superfamily flavin-nucleotide-binding protein